MASLSAPTFTFAPGKTWFMPVTYLQRNADGTAGAPVNLTGGTVSGILFARGGPSTGIPLTVANGGVTVDPTNGVMNFLVDETQSAGFVADTIPPFADYYNYPTRLEVDFRDTRGHLDVAAVFPIHVFDPRFVDPSTFAVAQTGTIVAPGSQLAAAPVLVNGVAPDASGNITLDAHDVGAVSADDVAALIAAALAKFSPAAPSTVSITLSASPASVSLGAQSAALTKANTLSVVPASVAFGARAVGLTRSTRLQATPALLAMAGGLATLLKTTATVANLVSAPGGGSNNTADHSDPNNAYLAAMAA